MLLCSIYPNQGNIIESNIKAISYAYISKFGFNFKTNSKKI